MIEKTMKILLATVFFAMVATASAQAAVLRIAQNDGTVSFSAASYMTGLGTSGDANFIAMNLTDYDALGAGVTIRVTMDNVVDYFRPTAGNTLLGMLTSSVNHLWSASEDGAFVTPDYFAAFLGGSAPFWPANFAGGDVRGYLSAWGSTNGNVGGCCTSDNDETLEWGQSFTMDLITPVPLPAGLPLMALGLGLLGLAAHRRRG